MAIVLLWAFAAGAAIWLMMFGFALWFEHRTRAIEKNLDPWSKKPWPAQSRGKTDAPPQHC